MLNQVNFIGRLTNQPSVRTLDSGTKMTTFVLAVNRIKSKNNVQDADFPFIICFGKLAEISEKYLSKGDLVYVDCRYQTSQIVDKDGIATYRNSLVCNKIEFLSKSDKNVAEIEKEAVEKAEELTDEEISYFEEVETSESLPF
ncbi:MAG: single-stranded DNA-binding protein [Peptostreptococcaceae bacterium]|nr:single-stranded DNA-binding protein [Peptostreptococcaceae bacterium]MDY5739402.1 single-stranded DNA-binding protein [Anaerovoracaceae bacterium]